MNKLQVIKGYEFYNTVYSSKDNEELQANYEDWKHKESIRTVYLILDSEEVETFNSQGWFSAFDCQVFSNKQDAIEEMNEMNN